MADIQDSEMAGEEMNDFRVIVTMHDNKKWDFILLDVDEQQLKRKLLVACNKGTNITFRDYKGTCITIPPGIKRYTVRKE